MVRTRQLICLPNAFDPLHSDVLNPMLNPTSMSAPAAGIGPLRVRHAQPGDMAAWQKFVDAAPDAGALHHAGWYHVLRDAFWVQPYFLVAVDGGDAVRGILPLYYSRSPIAGVHLSSLEGGVLAVGRDAAVALLGEAEALRDRLGVDYLQLRGGAVERPAELTVPKIHTTIDATRSVEALWTAVKKKSRWAIRKAQKQDLRVSRDIDLNGLDSFYWIYAAHMRDLGSPAIGLDAFRAIRRHLGWERLRLYFIHHGTRPIGGMLCILNGERWTDYYAAVRSTADIEFANYQLHWHVIRDAAQSGAISLDFGRSTPNSNVHLFKRKWGGRDVEFPYHFYANPSVRKRDPGLQRIHEGQGTARRLWSYLPLALSNRLGPLLRKQLPFI
jgi:FemAB-related protein (PEP-CTERM system-associated)